MFAALLIFVSLVLAGYAVATMLGARQEARAGARAPDREHDRASSDGGLARGGAEGPATLRHLRS